ncbi:hypothetical protein GNZ12_38080 [Paraburkholderia sp. 1N]|uniref:Uncharacterized protein n=1 Tax=Paraburkholderia solitsugae TaxID=2675748 RepID=A0ABX2C357_9BURK|nr:hypothetical protein [Paraburkholderia solitsugae]NPT47006.1 hypothetical protein [Paraburkholderia solitsugae]
MANSLHIPLPVAVARPRGAHRFEAFSPKLARRVMFYRRPLLDQWLLLETNPKVIAFCERPGYVVVNGSRRLADFWVRYFGHQELVILIYSELDILSAASPRVCEDNELPIRFFAPAELAAARVWLDNWQQMLPYLVTSIGLVPLKLAATIVHFLKQAKRLLDIEREFSSTDPALVRATLFGLLHDGRVSSCELQTQPLSLLTPFVAAEETL